MNSRGYLANPSRSAQIQARNAGALTNSEARSMGLKNYRDEMDDDESVGRNGINKCSKKCQEKKAELREMQLREREARLKEAGYDEADDEIVGSWKGDKKRAKKAWKKWKGNKTEKRRSLKEKKKWNTKG